MAKQLIIGVRVYNGNYRHTAHRDVQVSADDMTTLVDLASGMAQGLTGLICKVLGEVEAAEAAAVKQDQDGEA